MLLVHLLTFYFILLTFLQLSIDYCFISHIVKLRLSIFFQNKEHDDDDDAMITSQLRSVSSSQLFTDDSQQFLRHASEQ